MTAAARVLLEELKAAPDAGLEEDDVYRALDSLESFLLITATNCPFIGALSHSSITSRLTLSSPGAEYSSFEAEKADLMAS